MGHVAYSWPLEVKQLIGNKIGFKYNDVIDGYVDTVNKILYVIDGQYKTHEVEVVDKERGWGKTVQEWTVNGEYASIRTKLKQPWANYEGYTIVSVEVYTNRDCDYYDTTCLCGDEVIKDGWLTSSDDAWFAEYHGGLVNNGYWYNKNYNCTKITPKHIDINFDLDELEKECGIV